MKFAVTKEHRDFFYKNRAIEFEGVLSSDEIELVESEAARIAHQRRSSAAEKFIGPDAEARFAAGRDLWRRSDSVRRIACSRRFGELAYQLTDEKPVRMGYDQLIPSLPAAGAPLAGLYAEFLKKTPTLEEFSSLQGVLCGILVALRDGGEESLVFPGQSGNAVFLHPEVPIHWPYLLDNRENAYYLIVYTAGRSVYMRNREDPLTGSLMQAGYTYGDRLDDRRNPVIIR